MGVYEHQLGDWRAYRVARSIDGKLHQAYFPHTREGRREAIRFDDALAKKQASVQKYFTGYAARWNSSPPRKPRRKRTV